MKEKEYDCIMIMDPDISIRKAVEIAEYLGETDALMAEGCFRIDSVMTESDIADFEMMGYKRYLSAFQKIERRTEDD